MFRKVCSNSAKLLVVGSSAARLFRRLFHWAFFHCAVLKLRFLTSVGRGRADGQMGPTMPTSAVFRGLQFLQFSTAVIQVPTVFAKK